MTAHRARDFADELTAAIETLPRKHAAEHGFGLMLDEAKPRPRGQAHKVLLAEHLLATSISDWPGRCVLMKGLEVAQLYRTTLCRPFRDVDILVSDAEALWDVCVADGYSHRSSDPAGIDHHHLPPLLAPFGKIGLDIHTRPNLPRWAHIDPAFILETAQPSRTNIAGIWRPRDDVHALLMVLHAWKSGFTRQRDLYDAALLAASSTIPVEDTARSLGLERVWRWSIRITESVILGRNTIDPRLARLILPTESGIGDRRRVRMIAPLLVANPARVARSHFREFLVGRAARRPSH